MPFWDEPYDLRSNEAIIGFDLDQYRMGSGFILRWNTIPASNYDFTDVYESHEFLTSHILANARNVFFAKDKGLIIFILIKTKDPKSITFSKIFRSKATRKYDEKISAGYRAQSRCESA